MDGVVRGAAEQEEEEAALVRRVEGPRDQGMDLRGLGEERDSVREREREEEVIHLMPGACWDLSVFSKDSSHTH